MSGTRPAAPPRGALAVTGVLLLCALLALAACSGCAPLPQASPGGPTTGEGEAGGEHYLTTLRGKVYANWELPGGHVADGDAPEVRVSFVVQRSGSIANLRVLRSSSWPAVDESALEAVRSSAPFPELPRAYSGDSLEVTIDFAVAP